VEVPYRPVCLEWDRGPQGHIHAWHHTWALSLVNLVLGAVGVVGSVHGTEVAHSWPVESWPEAGDDGMLHYRGSAGTGSAGSIAAFPGRAVTRPDRCDLFELFPVARHTRALVPEVYKDPDKYGIDHRVELLIHTAANLVAGGWADVQAVVDWYKSIDTVVGFAVEINETHEMDDIVLPLPTYVEENAFNGSHGDRGTGDAIAGDPVMFHQIHQAAVKSPEGIRPPVEVMMEIYDRAEVLDDIYLAINRSMRLKAPHLLEAGKRYTEEEVFDKHAKSLYGDDLGWDWFKENGVLVWKRTVAERYPGPFIKARVPVYLENFVKAREELDVILGEMDLSWDLSDYEPVPEWRPCEPFEQLRAGEIDAIGIHYKLPFSYGGQGNANPWTNELCDKLPHSYGVLINTSLAKKKGIKDGDSIWLESSVKKVKAIAHVSQTVHPEVLGIAGHAGHWSKGKPLAQGKGVNFNGLLPLHINKFDVISGALEHCAALKVSKA